MSPRRNVVAKAGVLRGISASLLASERRLQKNRRFPSCISLRHLIGCYCVLLRKGLALTHRIHHRLPRICRALLLPIAPVRVVWAARGETAVSTPIVLVQGYPQGEWLCSVRLAVVSPQGHQIC